MKPLNDKEKSLISNALRTAFDGQKQVTSEALEKFIFRVVNYDRREMANHVMEKMASVLSAMTNSERDLGRTIHPDAAIMITLFASMLVPKFSTVARELSEMLLVVSGVSFDKETNEGRTTFEQKYQFDKTMYDKVTDMLVEILDNINEGKEDNEKKEIAQRAKDAGFKRVDGDTIPDDVRKALVRMGIDVNKLHVIDLSEGDDEKPMTH